MNLRLMRLIDEKFLKHPFYGVPRMTLWLREKGNQVNHKRVERLMALMGLQAICPGPHTSKPSPEHRIYPYLLRNMEITKSDQVWAADITYIRMRHGFVYLVAIMDWFSRYVISWELSPTLENYFCVWALERALETGCPDIFNTDQGSQFTSTDFTACLKNDEIQISMDGRGRAFDNIFIERLWRTVKYEEVYLKSYDGLLDARTNLRPYFRFYNTERPHSSLGNRTPEVAYRAGK